MILFVSTLIANVSADLTYPPVLPPDYEIAYDDGIFGPEGRVIGGPSGITEPPTDFQIRALFTPTEDGLVHEVRIKWFGILPDFNSRKFYLIIEDSSSGTKVTSSSMYVNIPEWQVIDVSSLSFMTTGDFWVYVYPDYSEGASHLAIHADDDDVIEHPGRFQQRAIVYLLPWQKDWYNVVDLGIRVTITPSPFVIPEIPLGTVTAVFLSLAALALFSKRPMIKMRHAPR